MIANLKPYPRMKDSGVPMRTLEGIRTDILALERETEWLRCGFIGGGTQ